MTTPTRPPRAPHPGPDPVPPLVEPGAELTPQEVRRYARHLLIPDIGSQGQRRLKNARVLVVGAGGLGSPALLYLAAAGVGTIGIVDADVVEESNLQRQVVHGATDVGRLKVDSARERIAEVNPLVEVRTHAVRLDSGNALEILAGYDVVVDGTDNFPTRYLVNDACVLLGQPCVWGSIYRFDGQASVWFAGHGPCYRCIFPEPPPPGLVPSCAEGGVLGVLCAAIGSIQATEVVKLVTGVGTPLIGRLVVHDALRSTWREVPVRADPRCAVCGTGPTVTELVDYDEFCGIPSLPTDSAAPADGSVSVSTAGAVADSVSARELAELLAAREVGAADFVLVDVREPGEREIVVIPGGVAVPRADFHNGNAWQQLPFDKRVVLHCRSGVRSAECLELLRAAGHPDATHLAGGVLAWVRDVDPACRRTEGVPMAGPVSGTAGGGADDDRRSGELPAYALDVLEVVEQIPAGQVMSYGDVAEFLGAGGPRQVGRVMSHFGSDVPWWRVLRADGTPLAGHERRALAAYRRESTPMRPGGERVDMRRARWDGT